jgi:NADH-dependent peroxiredoxin subunit F
MSAYDVIIVGGGPAGLVAGRYCLQARLHTAIVAPELGSHINHPFALRNLQPTDVVWGAQLVAQFEQILGKAGGLLHVAQQVNKIAPSGTEGFALYLADGTTLEARAVILATGAVSQRLYVEGEKEFWGFGVSFSAVSHAAYFAERDVAVVGSHWRTLVAALELAPIARQIYLITALPHTITQLPEADRVLALPNITSFSDWEVQSIVGDDFVTGINLVGVNGETRQLAVEGIFVQMALMPNSEMVRGLVQMDAEGHITINQRCETTLPGLFAAGDVTNIHAEQVLVAMGEGAKAALSAWEYLSTNPLVNKQATPAHDH